MPNDDPPQLTLPAFTPVPRLCDRSNGWKPEVQRAFIEALAETGSVKSACRRVGRSVTSVYQLRHHPEAAGFRAAWDAALDCAIRRLEDHAMDRALYGVEETYFFRGKLEGRRRRFNESLVMFMLRNRAPERFARGGGARGLNAVDQAMLRRLKAQWRKEWEAERAALDHEEEQETLESLDRFLEDMRERRIANEAILAELPPPYGEDHEDQAPAEPPLAADPPAEPAPPEEPPPGPRIRTLKGEWE